MKKLAVLPTVLGLILMMGTIVSAENFQIIEVKRNIQMSENDPVIRDYYLNAGLSAGIKENEVMTAFRKNMVKDSTGTQNLGELLIPVGQLKIIFVSDKVAIAREAKNFPRSQFPLIDQIGFQVGDRLEISNKKTKK